MAQTEEALTPPVERRIDPEADARELRQLGETWRKSPGLWGRLTNVNLTSVGRRFIVTAFAFFMPAGLLTMMKIDARLKPPRLVSVRWRTDFRHRDW